MGFEFLRTGVLLIKVKVGLFQKIVHFVAVLIRLLVVLVRKRNFRQKWLLDFVHLWFWYKIFLRKETYRWPSTAEWASPSIKALPFLTARKIVTVFILFKRLNLDTAQNRLTFDDLRVRWLGFRHYFVVVFFVFVEEKLFVFFGLGEIFVFLQIALRKDDKLILFVHNAGSVQLSVSYGKRIWNFDDLIDNAVGERGLLPEVSLLFGVGLGFLLVFGCVG
jgi:hypothetical protein